MTGYMQMPDGRFRLLIVKPSSLGDVVHSLPFLHAIKDRYPDAEVHWVIAKGLEGLLEGNGLVGRMVVIDKDSWKRLSNIRNTMREFRRLFMALREERYDVVVDLQGLFRSGVITGVTGAGKRIGFSEAREGASFFYTHRIEGGRDIHAVDRYLKVAHAMGCRAGDVRFPLPAGDVTDLTAKEVMDGAGGFYVIVPGARWPTKLWSAANFGRLASMLPLKGLVIGGKADAALAEEVVRHSGGKAVSAAGRTGLSEAIAIIRGASFMVCNDTGPMHIAAALGLPVCAIFGPTDPQRTGPYGTGHIVIRSEERCSPCFKKRCDDLRCMSGISAETVLERIKPLVSKKRTRAESP